MQQHLIEQYQQHKQNFVGYKDEWLVELREEALAYFLDKGLPTTKEEHYKYTNLNKLARSSYHLSHASSSVSKEQISNRVINTSNNILVFINGYYSASHSQIVESHNNLYIANFATALKEKNKLITNYLGKQVSLDNSITALNTVMHQDGAVILLDKNVKVEHPIELVFIHHDDDKSMQHVRNLVIASENSQATLIEHHYALDESEYLKTIITEIDSGANSQLNYYKLQCENKNAHQLSQLDVHQHQDSHFNYMSLDIGGKLIRHDINIKLLSSNATCQLNGLYIAKSKQHIDNHTCIEHQSPYSTSMENFKGILDDKARAVFNGRVIVQEGAIKTNAQQNNANLLLSNDAEIDTKPQLEIFNDDVQCAHGATVGQLDEQALFYLCARGIDQQQAKTLLTFGFAKALINAISDSRIRHKFTELALSKLDAEQLIQESF